MRRRERRRSCGHAPAGIYGHAKQLGATVPGIDVPYEPSPEAELRLDTDASDPAQQVQAVVDLDWRLARQAASGLSPPAGA